MRILIIEDEVKTADYLHQGLTESDYIVDRANDGIDGLHMALQHPYELVILDVNLPGIDGWDLLRRLRERSSARVMMLTGHGRLTDKVRGLDLGADDFMVKPFQFPELLARVRSLLRRHDQAPMQDVLRVADLELDASRHRAFRGRVRINLTTKEFALLHLLMRRNGDVITRTQIISLIWDMNFDNDSNVVEVAICRLRAKIDDGFDLKLIHTIRGVGYVLEARR
ncbi:heavy metal response regulator transcription factor [Pseudomonas aeruginosa]|uniref:heavy metal response regulator transcription factor n=1 Tax=Pseudomonas aeruginosa TaxID=287 RepID=UPI00073985D9|nr:heavy metal response regulator transcription factor [Pseudomonas aeruginosa]